METIIYTKLEQKFMQEWQNLWDNSSFANYVNGPQWFLSVIESFQYRNFIIIALYENGKLLAVAALVKEKKYGINCYTVAPGDFACGIPFLIDIQNKKLIKVLTENLLKAGNIVLNNIPEQFVATLKENTAQIDSTADNLNFYMNLDRDEKGQVVIANRKKLLYRSRSIQEKFMLRSFDGENNEALDLAFNIDIKSRKHSRGYNTFSDNKIKDFYRSLAKHYGKNFLIHVLYFEEKPIAYRIGFHVGDTYFGSQTAFLNEYRQYWPGQVLFVKVVDSLVSKNIKKYDFGSGDNYFKRSITNTSRPLYAIIISQNFFIRNFIQIIYRGKNALFNQLRQHVRIYLIYRSIKKNLRV